MFDTSSTKAVTLLIPNLHCPSCVRHIEELLLSLPRVSHVSVSLLSRSAVLTINTGTLGGLDTRGATLEQVLDDVVSILSEAGGFEVKVGELDGVDLGGKDFGTGQAQTVNLQRHADHCESCRDDKNGSFPSSNIEESADTVHRSPEVIHTSLSIEGMTCASCSGSLSKALLSIEGVIDANISVMNHSGNIRHHSTVDPSTLVQCIEDMGYAGEIVNSTPDQIRADKEDRHLVRSIYTIEGMTCASCAKTISQAFSGIANITSVSVDVLGNKAVVHHSDVVHPDHIRSVIEGAGYPARVHESQLISRLSDTAGGPTSRTITLRVRGIHCERCVAKLNDFLNTLNVIKATPFTVNNDVTSIEYHPQQPWTIRSLVEGLDSVANDLSAEVVKKQSILARGQEIQKQELQFLAINCFAAILFAIPSFIIHMLSMVILPHHHPLAKYFMRPVWGAADLGTIIVWPLATCVQFGIGRIFYLRALAPLAFLVKGVLRPQRQRSMSRSSRWAWSKLVTFGSMDLLVALSTTVAYFSSLAMLIIDVRRPAGAESVGSYFSEVVLLTMFILMGRVLEAYAKSRTGDAVAMLGELRPDTALLVESSTNATPHPVDTKPGGPNDPSDLQSNGHRVISTDMLEAGDIIRLLPGSLPPADGVVLTGVTDFDEAALTGESRPVSKRPGDLVYTGTTNLTGAVTIRITGLGDGTMLESIINAVSDASTRKAPIEKLAERLTSIFVPTVVYLSLAVLAVWLALGLSGAVSDHTDNQNGGVVFWSFEFAIAVLVVACPCGIGLAVPCATAVGNGIAAKLGIIAAGGGEAFVGATRIGTIVFDKTGTLTVGKPMVTDTEWAESFPSERQSAIDFVTRLVEEQSTHPLAKGLVEYLCDIRQHDDVELLDSAEEAGKGIRATVRFGASELATLLIGNMSLAESEGATLNLLQSRQLQDWSSQGKSVVIVAIKDHPDRPAAIARFYAVADAPRPTTAITLARLKKAGLRTIMASGDNDTTARAIGTQLGFDSNDVYGGVGPQGKASLIEKLKTPSVVHRHQFMSGFGSTAEDKNLVMFVGDGLNDAVALAAADVAVAMGHGSQAIVSSADFVLLSADLASVLGLIDLSKRVTRRQKLNLAWACVFNMVAIPFAAGIFYPAGGIRLDPVWAAIVMACSSVSVVLSSLALRFGI